MNLEDYFRNCKIIEGGDLPLSIVFCYTLFVPPILSPLDTEYEIREESEDGYEWFKSIRGDEGHRIEIHEKGRGDEWNKELIEKYKGQEREIKIEEKWMGDRYYKINGRSIDKIIEESTGYGILDRAWNIKTLRFGEVEVYLTSTQQNLGGEEYWIKEFRKEPNILKAPPIAFVLEKREDEKGRKWIKSFKRII